MFDPGSVVKDSFNWFARFQPFGSQDSTPYRAFPGFLPSRCEKIGRGKPSSDPENGLEAGRFGFEVLYFGVCSSTIQTFCL